MLNLLRKDFIAMKSSLWLHFLYLAVCSVVIIINSPSPFTLFTVGIYTAFVPLGFSTMADIKNHTHNLLVTLPIKRKHIVQAKYIVAIIYTILGIFASYGIYWIMKLTVPQLNLPDYSITIMLASAGMMLVLISIYMPLFYMLSNKGAAIITTVFFIILFALMPLMFFMSSFINDQTIYLIPIGILLLFIASYFLTIKLFTRKDL